MLGGMVLIIFVKEVSNDCRCFSKTVVDLGVEKKIAHSHTQNPNKLFRAHHTSTVSRMSMA